MINLRNLVSIALRHICYRVFSLVPKEDGLVLCTAWFGQKYVDNTKYVYEYLLNNSNYKVVWVTKSDKIYSQLKREGKPVVKYYSLIGCWKQIRAQAVFSTVQIAEYNSFFLTNVVHIDLGHGHPIKDPGLARWSKHSLAVQNLYLKHNHFYTVDASDFAKEKATDTIPGLPPDHILISDFARNDVFVDSTLSFGKNEIITKYKGGRKAIVYMPTHRSDGKFVMSMREILPLDKIQQLCEQFNYVFIIKKHFYHRNEKEDLSSYSFIYDVTQIEDLDPQVLLTQSDILISDYSACYIDYLLLSRPLMFYQYDVADYQKNERSLYIPFTSLEIAPIAYNKNDFYKKLKILVSSDVDLYEKDRNEFAKTYFNNLHQTNGREKIKQILDRLIRQYYPETNSIR